MKNLTRAAAALLVWGCAAALPTQAAGPAVDILIGTDSPRLERFAAQELAGQLKQLFDADVKIADKARDRAQHVILVGSPATNTAVKTAAGASWPKMSDQGHLLRSVTYQGRKALMAGGGSPVATLWAVYELGHHFGIRYLLHGDVLPAEPAVLKLDALDLVLEPNLRTRAWRTLGDYTIGSESLGLAEQKRLLAQLAKLKFNRIVLLFSPWQPFVDYEFQGIKKSTAELAYGRRFSMEGDTPGRAAFKDETEFANPDLAGKTTYAEKTAAGIALARGILEYARELGMSTALAVSPLEFPKEFAAVLPQAKVLPGSEGLAVGPGPAQLPDDAALKGLATAQLGAYLTTYPHVDALYLLFPESSAGWTEHHEKVWERLDARHGLSKVISLKDVTAAARARKRTATPEQSEKALYSNLAALDFCDMLLADPALFKRPGGGKLTVIRTRVDPALFPVLDKLVPAGSEVLHFVDYTARRIAAEPGLLAQVPAAPSRNSSLILSLADGNVGVLSQEPTGSLHKVLGLLRQQGWEGFSTRYGILSDLDASTYYLARASFDARLSPQAAYEDLITPICGEGVAERVVKAFTMIEQAAALLDANDFGLTRPRPDMLLKHLKDASPPPASWKEANKLYASAMDEMYRALQRSRSGSRPYLLYLAKRLEFAVEYLGCLENLRLAALAQSKGETDKVTEHLEKAVEGIYNGLNALGEHARDNSDRALIAVLNAYGYRPLKGELERKEKAVKSEK